MFENHGNRFGVVQDRRDVYCTKDFAGSSGFELHLCHRRTFLCCLASVEQHGGRVGERKIGTIVETHCPLLRTFVRQPQVCIMSMHWTVDDGLSFFFLIYLFCNFPPEREMHCAPVCRKPFEIKHSVTCIKRILPSINGFKN